MVKDCATRWSKHPIDCPQTPLDWVLLGAAIAAAIPFIFANAVIFAYRDRKYFKAQGGVILILNSSVSGLIWIVATFVVNNHFQRDTKVLSNCVLWFFWLQIGLGFCPWWICIIMRLHKMHNLYKRAKESLQRVAMPEEHNWGFIPWGLAFLIPPIILSSLATKLPHVFTSHHHCNLSREWKLGTFLTVPPLYFSVFFVLLCRLRKHRDTLLNREYRQTCETAIVAFILYLLIGTTYITQGYRRVTGRCFLTFCICCLVFHHFWRQMWLPVYLCLFKTRSEMDRYEEEKGGTIVRMLQHRNSKFHIPCEEAFFAAFAELAIAPDRINDELAEIEDLKKQKIELTNNITRLKELIQASSNGTARLTDQHSTENNVVMYMS